MEPMTIPALDVWNRVQRWLGDVQFDKFVASEPDAPTAQSMSDQDIVDLVHTENDVQEESDDESEEIPSASDIKTSLEFLAMIDQQKAFLKQFSTSQSRKRLPRSWRQKCFRDFPIDSLYFPAPDLWVYFPAPDLQVYFPAPDLWVYFPALDLRVYFPALDLQVYFPALDLWVYCPVLDLLQTSLFPPINLLLSLNIHKCELSCLSHNKYLC